MRGAAADENDGLVARHLQALHQAQRHKVTDVQGIRRGVKADVEAGAAVVDQITDLLFVRDLCDQTSLNQFFINTHCFSSQTKIPCPLRTEDEQAVVVPPLVRTLLAKRPSACADTLRCIGRTRPLLLPVQSGGSGMYSSQNSLYPRTNRVLSESFFCATCFHQSLALFF